MFLNHHATRSRITNSRAFTLIELVISIGVIAILISIALYGLGIARKASVRTSSANALRQIVSAYISYANSHDGRLMPGYLDQAALTNLNIVAKLKNGVILNNVDASSYVWRLAPYLDHSWETFLADYRSIDVANRLTDEYAAGVYGPSSATGTQFGISLRPAFGLNSVYLGGDTTHGDPLLNPWDNPNGRVAALRMSEVKSPGKIIVFAPTRAGNSNILSSQAILGYPVLTPPFANFNRKDQIALLKQWHFDPGVATPDYIEYVGMQSTATAGLPVDRLAGNKVTVSHLDGSVTTEPLESLGPNANAAPTDKILMSRWSPFATGFN